ncbi:MAG: UDP-glucose 4-epimerase GalE [Bacteroidales bacterium]|nr:UDP-glucose 4-epimerase GalE [Bacteroidales bacterium]
MKKIIVTGGTGYIGSHTCVELINSGFEVIIIDDLSNSTIEVLNGIKKITGIKPEFYKIDLANAKETFSCFNKIKNVSGIIHFAAYKAVGESVNFPLKYYKNNLNSLINIIENMQEKSFKNIIFSSSCTVYGQAEKLPVTEQSPIIKADSPYGNTKQISEEIIYDTIKSTEYLKAISLRYFNPIGAHESSEIGELPIGEPANLVPYITQTAVGIRKQLRIFGNDYNTPDGTAIRDYIHITDLAKAHIAALNRLLNKENKINYEVFNIGTGKGNSVLEVVKTFEKVTGIKLNYKIVNRRPGDIEKIWADTSHAEKELGFKTEKSLGDALLSAWNWEKKYRNIT